MRNQKACYEFEVWKSVIHSKQYLLFLFNLAVIPRNLNLINIVFANWKTVIKHFKFDFSCKEPFQCSVIDAIDLFSTKGYRYSLPPTTE